MPFDGLLTAARRPRDAKVNPHHWAAPALKFAWASDGSRTIQNFVRSREPFTQLGTTPIVTSNDGRGVSSTVGDEAWYSVAANPSDFAGDLTMLWRGVLLGDCGTTNLGTLASVAYGNGTGAPYAVFDLSRDSANQEGVVLVTNNGAGSYVLNNNYPGLTGLYNTPVSIVVANAAGSNLAPMVVFSDTKGMVWVETGNALSAASGAPRQTSSTDRINLGCNLGSGRFGNEVTTAAAIWGRAFALDQLMNLARNHAQIFAPKFALEGAWLPPSVAASLNDNRLQTIQRGVDRGIARGTSK